MQLETEGPEAMREVPLLDRIEVATPCGADWNTMKGDDRSRFCGMCRLNVFNLSGMTREEAEALIENKEGRLCVRFFKREDGTVMTQDCPVGFPARARRSLAVALASVSAVASAVTFGAFGYLWAQNRVESTVQPVERVPEARMGEMAMPPARPAPAPPKGGAWTTGGDVVDPEATSGK